MVIETRSPEETFETGRKLGEKAVPGQVFTLMGDLGCGQDCVHPGGLPEDWESRNVSQQPYIYNRPGV